MAAKDYVLVQLEETPRYEGAVTTTPYRIATEKLWLPARTARIAPAPQYLDRSDELRGIAGAVPNLIDSYQPTGSLAVRAYLKELTWLLSMCGMTGVHTAGNGTITDPDAATIPTGAHRWVFLPTDGTITPQSAQVQVNYAAENALMTGSGFAVSQLTLPATGEITADLFGLVYAIADADTVSSPAVSSQAIYPIRRGDLVLTWLSGHGSLDVQNFTLTFGNSLERFYSGTLATPSFFPDLLEFGTARLDLTGSLPTRALTKSDTQALLAASTFSAKARWKTTVNIGATTYKYSLWVEMPACQFTGGEADEQSNTRRKGHSFTFRAAYDEASGFAMKVTLVNAEATIASYV